MEQVRPPKLIMLPKHPQGVEVDLHSATLPDKVQHLVDEGKAVRIVYFEKTERLCPCYMVVMKDFLIDFTCYELYYVDYCNNS